MVVLGLDPSSSCTGYAVMRDSETLVAAGVLSPADPKAAAILRVGWMMDRLADLIEEYHPERVIVEIPSGKVHRRLQGRKRNVSGLSVYGMAVGALFAVARGALGASGVEGIKENVWTRQVPKATRQKATAARFPQHRKAIMGEDDMADAIGVLVWWFETQEFRRVMAEQFD